MSRMLRRIAFLMLCCGLVAPVPVLAAKGAKLKAKDVVLDGSLPKITEEQLAFNEVPWAPGSPAVVLLQASQYEWQQGISLLRIHIVRRVKILNEEGVETYGNYSDAFYGGRITDVDARTVLPDGTVINAKDSVSQERSDTGVRTVHVSFPQVQVGAILDLQLEIAASSAWTVAPWIVQDELPVLESRFALIPPPGLRFRTVVANLPAESNQSQSVPLGPRGKAHVFRFTNIDPLPSEPNQPPMRDLAKRLYLILDSYKSEGAFYAIASDWKTYSEFYGDAWDRWLKTGHGQTDKLAATLTAGKDTEEEKAEAIRAALRDRIDVTWMNDWPSHDNADEVLSKGEGNTADVSGLAVAMLRAVGVEAHLADIRRRSYGTVPTGFPIPALFNDTLVRIQTAKGPLFFMPASDLAVGTLPFECSGIVVVPLDGATETPIELPDYTASENSTNRVVEGELDASGKLAGSSRWTVNGRSAQYWRAALKDKTAAEQRELLEQRFQAYLPGAQVSTVTVEQLDDSRKPLRIETEWEATGYVTRAGKRMLLNPNLFSRITADDWAAETRTHAVDLGAAYHRVDTMMLKLPEGVRGVTLPEPADLNAQNVGRYKASAEQRGSTLVLKRDMRLNIYRFGPEYYGQLRNWFAAIATADDRPVVIELP